METIAEEVFLDIQLEKENGYSLTLCFNDDELASIKQLIVEQWLDVIKQNYPDKWQQFSDKGIERYHELSGLLDHGTVWPKAARILPQKAVDIIRSTSLLKNLEREFGKFTISDEENVGREEIYWRLVRPNEKNDIGPLHADAWFWDLGHGDMPSGVKRVKVWVAICCEPGLNGLRIVPDSQKKEWKYTGVEKHGFVKPQIQEKESDLNIKLADTKPGDAIVFHDKLLHGGAPNKGKYTRVSMEFTMFVKKD